MLSVSRPQQRIGSGPMRAPGSTPSSGRTMRHRGLKESEKKATGCHFSWGDAPWIFALSYGEPKEVFMAVHAKDEKAIFLAALGQTSASERDAYIREACAGDA